MTRLWVGGLACAGLLAIIMAVSAQPPGGKDRPRDRDRPPPDGPGEPPPPPRGGPPGPPRWVPGRVMPPPVQEELGLTDEQRKQLADLEKDVKERLLKILTAEQKKKLEELRQRGPGGPPRDGPPPPPPGDDPPPRKPDRPDQEQARTDAGPGGIQWFATWASGLREAERTGRPILLVSAAPHCAGVSGCW